MNTPQTYGNRPDVQKIHAEQKMRMQDVLAATLERIAVKRAAGIKPATNQPEPTCPICKDRGYTETAWNTVTVCLCKSGAAAFNARTINPLSSIGKMQLLNSFNDFASYAGNLPSMKQEARLFAENPSGWLVMTGSVGNGKSHLCAAIHNELITRGVDVIYTPAPELIARLQELFDRKDDEDRVEWRINKFQNASVLIIDDLGAEMDSQWTNVVNFRILDYRYANMLPTVISSNLTPDQMATRLGSRMNDTRFRVINNTAPDFRRLPTEKRAAILKLAKA